MKRIYFKCNCNGKIPTRPLAPPVYLKQRSLRSRKIIIFITLKKGKFISDIFLHCLMLGTCSNTEQVSQRQLTFEDKGHDDNGWNFVAVPLSE